MKRDKLENKQEVRRRGCKKKKMRAGTWRFMKSAILEASFFTYEDGERRRRWNEGEGNDLTIRAGKMGRT